MTVAGCGRNGTVTLVYATVVQNSASTGANLIANGVLTSFGSVVAQAGGGRRELRGDEYDVERFQFLG